MRNLNLDNKDILTQRENLTKKRYFNILRIEQPSESVRHRNQYCICILIKSIETTKPNLRAILSTQFWLFLYIIGNFYYWGF